MVEDTQHRVGSAESSESFMGAGMIWVFVRSPPGTSFVPSCQTLGSTGHVIKPQEIGNL